MIFSAIFGNIWRGVAVISGVGLITLGGLYTWEKSRNEDLRMEVSELEKTVRTQKKGMLLLEQLRRENEALISERDGLLEELRNDPAYDVPLPGSLVDLLDRVRSGDASSQ